MFSFECKDWFKITGRGWVAVIYPEPEEVIKVHDQIVINGHEYTVKGISRSYHSSWGAPVRKNADILIAGERKDL